jgi:hypothetical protein
MQFAVAEIMDGQLTAPDKTDRESARGGFGFLQTVKGVMIREGDSLKTEGRRLADQGRGGVATVGNGTVGVQVNATAEHTSSGTLRENRARARDMGKEKHRVSPSDTTGTRKRQDGKEEDGL